MTSVFSFRPEYFNNNGDQGNIEALEHFSQSKFDPTEIQKADFVLIGDASRAAMREFEGELDQLTNPLQSRFEAGLPTLLVGSSYEFFCSRIRGLPELEFGARVSEFREISTSEFKVRGYRNSEILGNDFFMKGLFIGTSIYGPVLAKNIELVNAIAKGLGIELEISDEQRGWISRL